jgi:hypothetical protein
MNSVFKNMVGIPVLSFQPDNNTNKDIEQKLLNNEILEEHVDINNDSDLSIGENLNDIADNLSNKVFNMQ